ncbi:hypothetical protein F4825DRAFT_43528 [Nemania diffusa]|nr:hypothetical protein F4825DRAFT_43528 [Nemania diffusa]
MSLNAAGSSLESLKALVQSTTSLIIQFEKNLYSVAFDQDLPDSSTPIPARGDDIASVDALSLAHDSASLVKAHSTKLSLLIINEPFTPSAITRVLQELVAGPIPAIASAAHHYSADTYTAVARQDLASRCYRVLKELRGLVATVPLDGKILPANRKNGGSGGKGSIVTTGLIWAACDDVILLKTLGIAGLLVKKAEEYRDTLQDVLEELKEWSEEVDEEEDEEEEENQNVQHITNELQNTHFSTQRMIDDLMTSRRIPRNDPDRIRERLDSCIKRLRLTTLLYSAIIKRRIKTLPSLPTKQATNVAQRLDEVYLILQRLPHSYGDVACAFYELDAGAIDEAMDSCLFDACAVAEALKAPWTGTEDGFTEWADKFKTSVRKND